MSQAVQSSSSNPLAGTFKEAGDGFATGALEAISRFLWKPQPSQKSAIEAPSFLFIKQRVEQIYSAGTTQTFDFNVMFDRLRREFSANDSDNNTRRVHLSQACLQQIDPLLQQDSGGDSNASSVETRVRSIFSLLTNPGNINTGSPRPLLSPSPAPIPRSAPAPGSNADAPPNAEASGIDQQPTQAGSVLWQMYGWVQKFTANPGAEGAKAVGTALEWGLLAVQNACRDKPEYGAVSTVLTQLIPQLRQLQDSSEGWAVISQQFSHILHAADACHFSLNGLVLPEFSGTAAPVDSTTSELQQIIMKAAQIDAPPKAEQLPLEDSKIKTDSVCRELGRRGAQQFAMRIVWESICGFKVAGDFYAHIFQSQNPNSAFFAELGKQKLFFLTRWFSYALFYILLPILSFFNYFFGKHIVEYIRSQRNHAKNDTSTIKRLSTFLTQRSEAYETIAKRSTNTHELSDQLNQDLDDPEKLHRMSRAEVNAKLATKSIDRFAPRFEWTQQISAFFDRLVIPSTSFLACFNLILWPLSFACSLLMRAALWLPQVILNGFVLWVFKRFATSAKVIDGMTERTVNAPVTTNAFTFNLYKWLFALLSDLKESLLKGETVPDGEKLSRADREQIRIFVKLLQYNLKLSRFDTIAELKSFLNHDSIGKSFEELAESLFIGDSMDAVSDLLILIRQILNNEAEFEKHLGNFLVVLKDSFESVQIPEDTFVAQETATFELINEILQLAIRMAVEKQYSFKPDKPKKVANDYVSFLKEQTVKFTDTAQTALSGIASLQAVQSDELRRLIGEHKAFLEISVATTASTLNHADLDSHTRSRLEKLATPFTSHHKQYHESVSQLHQCHTAFLARQIECTEAQRLEGIFEAIQTNPDPLTSELSGFSQQLHILSARHLNGAGLDVEEAIKGHYQHLGNLHSQLKSLTSVSVNLQALERLKEELQKQKKKSSSGEIAKFQQAVLLSISDAGRGPLSQCLQTLIESDDTAIDTAFQAAQTEIQRLEELRLTKIQDLKTEVQQVAQKAKTALQDQIHLLQDAMGQANTQYGETFSSTQQSLTTLSEAASSLTPLEFTNIQTMAGLAPVIEWVKRFAFNQIRTQVHSMVKLCSKPDMLKGFFTHLIALPFIEND